MSAQSTASSERIPAPYEERDISPFTPSSAIYFMDGYSEATIRLLESGEELTFAFEDSATSIAASEPVKYDEKAIKEGVFLVAPKPLESIAHFPSGVPKQYKRSTRMHLLQVVSMNMRGKEGNSRLLIGLPYAEKYPSLFFDSGVFESGIRSAFSYGAVSSLVEAESQKKQAKKPSGYPARSIFSIYHVIETPVGNFFNKKPTVMELQPDKKGKLALTLPPIPFMYHLINGPIQLYDVEDPSGPPVAETVNALHGSHDKASGVNLDNWPWHMPSI